MSLSNPACQRCRYVQDSGPVAFEWLEHWHFVTSEIDELVQQIDLLEAKVNVATQKKRFFQKLYEDTFGVPPPDTISRATPSRCHGYILDQVEEEYDNWQNEKSYEKDASGSGNGGGGQSKGRRAMLKRVFSMSYKGPAKSSIGGSGVPFSTLSVSPPNGGKSGGNGSNGWGSALRRSPSQGGLTRSLSSSFRA